MKWLHTLSPRLLVIIFSGSTALFINAGPGDNLLLELAKNVTKARYTERKYARDQLLITLKDTQTVKAQTLSAALTAYHYEKETLLFSEHSHTLYEAINVFAKKPGFKYKIYELIKYADNESFVQGHVYEIEKALELHNRGEKITHFGYQFLCEYSGTTRSIDLATESHLIECKNINWSIYTRDSVTNIQNQLLSYQKHALSEPEPKQFILHSKQPISENWKKWLNENKIAYEEDLSS